MQNITTEWSNKLSYNNSDNKCTLPIAQHCYKTRCGQTDRPTADRPTAQLKDRHTDSATHRAAIAVKNVSHIECHNTHKLITAL